MDGQMTDEELIGRIRCGDAALFEVLMRRYNQRLYRVARAIVKDDSDAEDVIQQAYVNAYCHLDQFADRAKFSTWLTRIAIHEALARARKAVRLERLDRDHDEQSMVARVAAPGPDPEHRAYSRELGAIIEAAVAALPETVRGVFMLREVEGLSTHETAVCLGIHADTVKTRLYRARAQLRRDLTARIGPLLPTAFPFQATRCDRVVATVIARLAALGVWPADAGMERV